MNDIAQSILTLGHEYITYKYVSLLVGCLTGIVVVIVGAIFLYRVFKFLEE